MVVRCRWARGVSSWHMGHGRFLRRAHRRERRGQETEIEKIKIQDETRPCAAAPWPHSSGRHCGMRAGRRARVRPRVSTLRSTFKVSYFFLPVPEMEGRRTILLFNVHVPYILTQLAVETHRVSKAELQDTTTPSSELSPFRVGPCLAVRAECAGFLYAFDRSLGARDSAQEGEDGGTECTRVDTKVRRRDLIRPHTRHTL